MSKENCLVCYNGGFAECDATRLLRGFKVCSEHKSLLEKIKEKYMNPCSVCGSQDTKFIKGISKKTGKPYSGWKCQEKQCGNLDFVKDRIQPSLKTPSPISTDLLPILKNIAEGVKRIEIAMGTLKPLNQELKTLEESQFGQETPF